MRINGTLVGGGIGIIIYLVTVRLVGINKTDPDGFVRSSGPLTLHESEDRTARARRDTFRERFPEVFLSRWITGEQSTGPEAHWGVADLE
jgi:hypothetical protein